jgi:hypothetical protein
VNFASPDPTAPPPPAAPAPPFTTTAPDQPPSAVDPQTPATPSEDEPQYTPAGYQTPHPELPPPTGVSGLAIASLILGVIGAIPISVILGIAALSQIRRSNRTGRGMAVVGLILSGVWLAAICTVLAIAFAMDASRTSGGDTGSGKGSDVSVHTLRVGECVSAIGEDDFVDSMPVVPCAAPHDTEVVGEFQLAGDAFPGDDAIEQQADDRCDELIESYAPGALADPEVERNYFYPSEEGWAANDRTVICMATFDTPRSGSLKD